MTSQSWSYPASLPYRSARSRSFGGALLLLLVAVIWPAGPPRFFCEAGKTDEQKMVEDFEAEERKMVEDSEQKENEEAATSISKPSAHLTEPLTSSSPLSNSSYMVDVPEATLTTPNMHRTNSTSGANNSTSHTPNAGVVAAAGRAVQQKKAWSSNSKHTRLSPANQPADADADASLMQKLGVPWEDGKADNGITVISWGQVAHPVIRPGGKEEAPAWLGDHGLGASTTWPEWLAKAKSHGTSIQVSLGEAVLNSHFPGQLLEKGKCLTANVDSVPVSREYPVGDPGVPDRWAALAGATENWEKTTEAQPVTGLNQVSFKINEAIKPGEPVSAALFKKGCSSGGGGSMFGFSW